MEITGKHFRIIKRSMSNQSNHNLVYYIIERKFQKFKKHNNSLQKILSV